MKNKKRQLVKGIMLATVLGLGWSVAGDISHAAGNEISQSQIVQIWKIDTTYKKGDIVIYNDILFTTTKDSSKGHNPEESYHWKPLNGFIPKWHEFKPYDAGDIVTYQGSQYKAQMYTIAEQPSSESATWEKVVDGAENTKKENEKNAIVIKEWMNKEMYYNVGTIVVYNGVKYKKVNHSYNDSKPGTDNQSWEKVVDGAENTKKENEKNNLVNKEAEVYKRVYTDPNSSGVKALTNGLTNGGRATFLSQTDSNRAVNNGWNTLYGKTYYVENNHWVVDTVKVIDGIEYFFAKDGVATKVE